MGDRKWDVCLNEKEAQHTVEVKDFARPEVAQRWSDLTEKHIKANILTLALIAQTSTQGKTNVDWQKHQYIFTCLCKWLLKMKEIVLLIPYLHVPRRPAHTEQEFHIQGTKQQTLQTTAAQQWLSGRTFAPCAGGRWFDSWLSHTIGGKTWYQNAYRQSYIDSVMSLLSSLVQIWDGLYLECVDDND